MKHSTLAFLCAPLCALCDGTAGAGAAKSAPWPGFKRGLPAPGESSDVLYSTARSRARRRSFTAIPYALWQNRGPAEMRVWLREKG